MGRRLKEIRENKNGGGKTGGAGEYVCVVTHDKAFFHAIISKTKVRVCVCVCVCVCVVCLYARARVCVLLLFVAVPIFCLFLLTMRSPAVQSRQLILPVMTALHAHSDPVLLPRVTRYPQVHP